MSKKYLFAIGDVVRVPVKTSIADVDGKGKEYKFSLTCERLGAEALSTAFASMSPKDFLMKYTTGWADQKLVLNDDRTPAEFCADALEALLDIQGLVMVVFNAYLKSAGATEKN